MRRLVVIPALVLVISPAVLVVVELLFINLVPNGDWADIIRLVGGVIIGWFGLTLVASMTLVAAVFSGFGEVVKRLLLREGNTR